MKLNAAACEWARHAVTEYKTCSSQTDVLNDYVATINIKQSEWNHSPSFNFFGCVLNLRNGIATVAKRTRNKSLNCRRLLAKQSMETKLFVWICDGGKLLATLSINRIFEAGMVGVQRWTVHEHILCVIQIGDFPREPVDIAEILLHIKRESI